MDISSLPDKQANRLELPLEKQAGSLLLVISVAPCSGVSISDLCISPLGDPNERKQISQRYVSLDAFLFKNKTGGGDTKMTQKPEVLKVGCLTGRQRRSKNYH